MSNYKTGTSREELAYENVEFRGGKASSVKYLLGAIFVLGVATLALSAGLLVLVLRIDDGSGTEAATQPPATTPVAPAGPKLCTSPGCIEAASRILQNMDAAADPCQDFYQYACGNFDRLHVIPDDKSRFSVFDVTRDKLQAQLKSIPLDSQAYEFSKSTKAAQQFLKSCMDTEAIEAAGVQPALDVLQKQGGWTVANDSDDNPNAWETILGELRHYDLRYLVGVDAEMDMYDTSKRVISIDQTGLGLPSREKYLLTNVTLGSDEFWKNPTIASYLKLMNDYAGLTVLRGSKDQALLDKVNNRFKKLIEFEAKIAEITAPMSERRNSTAMYNPTTLGGLKKDYPNVDWAVLLESTFKGLIEGLPFKDNETVIVTQPSFFKQLNDLLPQTDKKLVKEYLVWRVIKTDAGYFNSEFQEAKLAFEKVVYGVQADKPRWQRCQSLATSGFGFAMGKVYIDQFFNQEAKQNMLDMIAGIRQEFLNLVDKLDWMDAETKEKTKEKANSMGENIAYPDFITDKGKLDKIYESLEMPAADSGFFTNAGPPGKLVGEWTLTLLRTPTEKGWPDMRYNTVAIVNAFYYPTYNAIVFPAGILQPPFFSADGLKVLNYGAIGAVIGHEITHGFDDQGRQTDKDGNVNDWWSPGSVEKFVEKAQCIIDQYSNFTMEAFGTVYNVNGTNTQGENIADNGGLKESFAAYDQWQKSNGKEDILPGLQDMSHEKLFFMSFANVWCGKMRPESVSTNVQTAVHSPGPFRVKGTVSNMPQFAAAFECAANTPMNPTKKCAVW